MCGRACSGRFCLGWVGLGGGELVSMLLGLKYIKGAAGGKGGREGGSCGVKIHLRGEGRSAQLPLKLKDCL